ncbi:MAG: aspartate/glutamate racemase family protein [Verrucomicrobiales bacterium]
MTSRFARFIAVSVFPLPQAAALLLALLLPLHPAQSREGAAGDADEAALDIVAHAVSDPEGKAAFTFRPADFSDDAGPDSRRDLPIGVFDSGIGGLTVLEAILASDHYHNDSLEPGPDGRPDFENESFIYFGDQANMPYGNYAGEDRTDTLREHILKDAAFLLGRRYWTAPDAEAPSFDKPPVKAVVVACNTATAWGLDDLRSAFAEWDIPVHVVGVVEAGARGLQSIWKDQTGEAVAVMATVGTCESGAYPRMIQSTLGRAGYGPAVITQHGSPSLAGALEGAPEFQSQSIAEIVREDVHALVRAHREQFASASSSGGGDHAPRPIGAVMLGCTHFPLAQQEIDEAFTYWKEWTDADGTRPFAPWIAERRRYVDPATWTARELFQKLAASRLSSRRETEGAGAAAASFYISVPNPQAPGVALDGGKGFTHAYKYGRPPNRLSVEDTRIVPLVFEKLPATSRSLIQDKLPHVARAMGQ